MLNIFRTFIVTTTLAVLASPALAQQPAARVTSTDGRVELTDSRGDVARIIYRVSVGDGPEKEVPYPGFDVVKLLVSSDGKAITFATTLTAAPAQAAYEVIEFHVDADNNARTGVTYPDTLTKLTGLEYYGTLEVCLLSGDYPDAQIGSVVFSSHPLRALVCDQG